MKLHYGIALMISMAGILSIGVHGQEPAKKITRYARFQVGDQIAYGIVESDRVRRIDGDLFGTWKPTDQTYKLSEVKLLVPTTPSKIMALIGNYQSHLDAAAVATPPASNPQIFIKLPSSLLAEGGKVVIPKGTERVDFEAEMVVVIGKRAKNVPEEKAKDYVLGVTCGNDISARDWQRNDGQWWRAKGSDTFSPCGPFIVAGLNYDDLLLQLRLNGEVMQQQRTSDMIHNVAQIVSWISRHVTLEPGDLIYTGTPGKTAPIKPGDKLEVELEGVGVLTSHVVAAE